MAYITKGAPTESLEQYLARGGKVTTCRPEQRKRKKVYSEEGPDYDTREQEAEVAVEDEINMDLVPAELKITLGITE